MKLCSIGYLPAAGTFNVESFRQSVQQFKSKYPVLLFSPHPHAGEVIQIGNPDRAIRETGQPTEKRHILINNLVFFTALRIAMKQGFTHAIYLETDCRVGRDYWDELMFEEFFNCGRHVICGGSMVVYNPCNSGPKGYRRWGALVEQNQKRNFPIPTYGWKGAADNSGSCVFVNGALGIYDIAWMAKLFDLENTFAIATDPAPGPWDMMIGFALWKMFGEDTYDVLLHMKTIFSSYGDVITTELERQTMLKSGQFVAVHQIKSAWVI